MSEGLGNERGGIASGRSGGGTASECQRCGCRRVPRPRFRSARASPGLGRALDQAGQISMVRVTPTDRLARFGSSWFRQLLVQARVVVEVASAKGWGEW